MKTKLFTLLIALATSVGTMLHAERCLVASGYCGAEGDSTNLRWELGCDSVLNIYGTGKMADYIDSTMMPWFGYHLSFIQKARLSDSITHIGSMAFHDVRSVKEINLPRNLQSIGEYAISYCTLLKTIEIPSGVTSIDNWAFDGCENLRTIINHATTPQPIKSNVFYYYTYRSGTLYVPAESVELYRAAEGWSGFTNIRPIKCLLASGYCGAEGDGTNLHWELGCDSVLNIYGTGDMRDYRDSAELPWQHYRLSAIKRVELSEGITRIGSHAFESMSALDTVIVPKSVKSIGSGAFLYNELRTLALQEGLERIDDYAFEGCYNLWRVILPSTVEYIGEGAFHYCSSIHSFEAIDNPHFVTHDGVLYRKDTMTLIQYPSGRYDEEYTIPYRCDTICPYAFYSCRYLRSLVFRRCPNSMRDAFDWYDSVSLYVPCGAKEQFMSLSGLPERRIYESVGAPEYAVTLNTNGSGLVNQSDMQVLCSGTEMTITAYPYSGYHFVQWSDSVTDNPRNVHITRDTTFTAVFVSSYYPVVLLGHDGTLLSKQSVAYNHAAQAPETPIREGYTFVGWTTDIEHIIDTTYAIAVYEKIGGTVIYKAENGEIIGSENVDLHLPEAPVISGKTFSGWLTEQADNNGIVLRATYTLDNPTIHEDVVVVPGSNTATVNFPYITGSLTYELIIRDTSGRVICKIMFNSTGHLLGIALAPGRNRTASPAPETGFNFTVEGLDANTTYEYEFVAYDETDSPIETLTGSFITTDATPTSVQNVAVSSPDARKLLINGQIFILRGEKVYNAQGALVK